MTLLVWNSYIFSIITSFQKTDSSPYRWTLMAKNIYLQLLPFISLVYRYIFTHSYCYPFFRRCSHLLFCFHGFYYAIYLLFACLLIISMLSLRLLMTFRNFIDDCWCLFYKSIGSPDLLQAWWPNFYYSFKLNFLLKCL